MICYGCTDTKMDILAYKTPFSSTYKFQVAAGMRWRTCSVNRGCVFVCRGTLGFYCQLGPLLPGALQSASLRLLEDGAEEENVGTQILQAIHGEEAWMGDSGPEGRDRRQSKCTSSNS